MEIVLNATLAGGVAVGTSSDLVTSPWFSILIGFSAGIISAIGYAKIGPALLNSRLALHDTCGVHNLHAMPGVLGGIFGAIAIGVSDSTFGNKTAFPVVDMEPKGGRTAGEQAGFQILALLFSLLFGIGGGLISGFICTREFMKPLKSLFNDFDHWEGVEEDEMMDPMKVGTSGSEYLRKFSASPEGMEFMRRFSSNPKV